MTDRRERDDGDPAGDAAALILRLGIFVLAILLPCAAVISRRPIFVLTPIGAILVILGSRLAPGRPVRTLARLTRATLSPLGIATLLFVIWAGLSLAWTPFPAPAVDRFLKTAGTVIMALIVLGSLPNRIRASNANLLPIGVAAAALAIVVVAVVAPQEARSNDFDSNTIQRALIGLVVLVWPALGALAMRERVAAAGIVAVAVAIAAVAVWLPSALAALILAILAFSFAYSNPARTGVVLGSFSAILILAAPAIPLVVMAVLPGASELHGASAMFSAWADIVKSEGLRLVTGHGFDASVRAYALGRLSPDGPRGMLFEIWFELGVLGAVAAAGLSYVVFSIAGRASTVIAPFLLAALTCIIALGVAGQPISQLWWLTLICAAAISFAVVMRGARRPERVRSRVFAPSLPG